MVHELLRNNRGRKRDQGWLEEEPGRHHWSPCEPPSWSSWDTFSKICISLKKKNLFLVGTLQLYFFIGGIHSSNKYLIESLILQSVFQVQRVE